MRRHKSTRPPVSPRPVRVEIVVTVAAGPEDVWPFVADTDRMDRAAGLPRVSFATGLRPEGGELAVGEYRLLGRAIARWVEHPFEWTWPRRFAVLREYQIGPLLRFRGGTELTATGSGTRLRSFVEITPRYRWLAWVVRFVVAPIGLRRAARQHRDIDRFLSGRSAEPFPQLAAVRSRADSVKLAARLDRLAAGGAPPEPVERLRLILMDGADEDVAAMRPLELARRWGLDGRETVEAFVRAAVAGVLELRWEVLCPRCRGVKASAAHLRDLALGGFCPTCNLHYFAKGDEAVEARFYPNPAVRRVDVGVYCVGSPTRTPHRLAQAELEPGARRVFELDLAPGRYQVTSPQCPGVTVLEIQPDAERDSAATPTVVFSAAGPPTPESLTLAAGACALRLESSAAFPITVSLDDVRWQETGATPGRLMTLPAFRDLLSGEALAPGYELAIGRVGLLFSDLAGSTALYERIGDARAFRVVGEHFALLRGAIEDAGGAVVKTIGDAIMAAFPDGRSAVAGAVAMQGAIRGLRAEGVADPARLLKVGVHVGACYAVTLDGRLDYFGTAVNLAARAQHEAKGGEVVLSVAALEEGEVELEQAGLTVKPFEVELRGFSAPVRLFRADAAARSNGPALAHDQRAVV